MIILHTQTRLFCIPVELTKLSFNHALKTHASHHIIYDIPVEGKFRVCLNIIIITI